MRWLEADIPRSVHPLKQFADNLLFVAVVIIQIAWAYSTGFGDMIGADFCGSFFIEEAQGSIQNLFTCSQNYLL